MKQLALSTQQCFQFVSARGGLQYCQTTTMMRLSIRATTAAISVVIRIG
jgi:hypothetical protein